MREAMYYQEISNNKVQCTLCPHQCVLNNMQYGICRVRYNQNGILYTDLDNIYSAVNIDPIEKKPLYHFFPGKKILSVGSFGCNMRCKFCQNWEISQCGTKGINNLKQISSEKLIKIVQQDTENIGIAYTYNEPTVFYESMYETAKLAHKANLKNVLISNGFINQKPLLELIKYIDACNIDLKSFNNEFYNKICGANLESVKNTLITLYENNIHTEIAILIISGYNDNETEFQYMIDWIADNLGENIVVHINKYFPNYKMNTSPTNIETLNYLYKIAKKD